MDEVEYNDLENSFSWIDEEQKTTVIINIESRQKIGDFQDTLAKVVGRNKSVLDGTAGLCRDAVHLARLGNFVTALERNSILYASVSRALALYKGANPKVKIDLIHSELVAWLKDHKSYDVIYLDPMFPLKKKSAKPGKESQLLQKLCVIPTANEEKNMIEACLSSRIRRTVIKRPLYSDFFADREPHHSVEGKSIRYDVYLSE